MATKSWGKVKGWLQKSGVSVERVDPNKGDQWELKFGERTAVLSARAFGRIRLIDEKAVAEAARALKVDPEPVLGEEWRSRFPDETDEPSNLPAEDILKSVELGDIETMIHAEGNMRLREYSTEGGKQIEIGVDDGGVEKVFRFSTTPWSVEGGEWVYKEDVVNAIKALDIDTSEIDGGLRTFLGDNWEDEYTGKGSEESAEGRSLERTIGTREERETEGAQGLPEYEVGAEEAGAV